MNYRENIYVKRLPQHLQKFIVEQDYASYTPIDHAVWRYIMRINYDFLSQNAHVSYIQGLKDTGLSIEKIPDINEMNEILNKIGWGAVCVDGFIPPAAFMEFQAYKVLVIAAEIRNIGHLMYTPAPDIVHEAAGHAPIISDLQYAEYLRFFGDIGSKAIGSKKDYELYQAIRKLSILKENPNSTHEQISNAEIEISEIQKNMGEPSELAKIRNLHWWSVEYGLIGEINNPKIYGAGLLSSISESFNCLKSEITKLPYDINTTNYSFDITKPQPQLFVTPDFKHLCKVLNDFADTMSLRKGGAEGVEKAILSESIATCELDSGIQISGVFSKCLTNENNEVIYIQTIGESILCENNGLLTGHEAEYHADGYGTPIGKIKGMDESLCLMSENNLSKYGIIVGNQLCLEFESGVKVQGKINLLRKNAKGRNIIIQFDECNVNFKDQILFKPEWGLFDMAIGERIVSVFSGSADQTALQSEIFISSTKTIKNQDHNTKLNKLYADIRNHRDLKISIDFQAIYSQVKNEYPDDWLLSLEIYELIYQNPEYQHLENALKESFRQKSNLNDDIRKLLTDGIRLIEN